VVNVKLVVRVFHYRHAQALEAQGGYQPLDQRGLARTGKTGESNHIHFYYSLIYSYKGL
jgi:hypothetical protein